jgi:hypothetical protein
MLSGAYVMRNRMPGSRFPAKQNKYQRQYIPAVKHLDPAFPADGTCTVLRGSGLGFAGRRLIDFEL